ncbi:hypothetical protein LOTGIDRAFT_175627, partial [Lottia gigantea]
DLKLDKGCVGQYISSTARKANYPPIIQWQTSYNGWQLLMCEIKQLLYQVSHGAGDFNTILSTQSQGAGDFNTILSTQSQGAGDFNTILSTQSQGAGDFNTILSTQSQGAGDFNTILSTQSQGAGDFNTILSTQSQGTGDFNTILSTQSQGAGDFNTILSTQSQGAGDFNTILSTQSQGAGDFNTILSTQSQGTGDFNTILSTQSQGAGDFNTILSTQSQGAGNVSAMQINRVTMVMTLVKEIMNSDPDSVEEFSDIIGLSFDVLHRFSTLSPPPLELISNTMECLYYRFSMLSPLPLELLSNTMECLYYRFSTLSPPPLELLSNTMECLYFRFSTLSPPPLELLSNTMECLYFRFSTLSPPLLELLSNTMECLYYRFSMLSPPPLELNSNTMECLYYRFSTLSPPPLELLSNTMECLYYRFNSIQYVIPPPLELLSNTMECLYYRFSMLSPPPLELLSNTMECLYYRFSTLSPPPLELLSNTMECLYFRFSTLSPPPLELLSNTMECLKCSAIKHPKPIWHSMKQTGFLPYMTENLDNVGEILSGRGLHAGLYGTILARSECFIFSVGVVYMLDYMWAWSTCWIICGRGLHAGLYGTILARSECIEARYPLTQAVLVFITNLIEPLTQSNQEEELVPTILYVLREVFPVFRKWRFSQTSSSEALGQKCLDLFHKILNFLHLQKKAEKKGIQLQEVCVYSMLFTEAGRALLEIIAIGVDNIEMSLSQQGSATEGDGIEEIELIQIAFSVLNRLLLLKPPDLPISPVEQALSSQPPGRQHQHVVATIVQYIYHRHNPKLPTLALVLLKRLAMVSPMSILACLGPEAEPVRDMFLTRLSALSEDLRLKVVILEFLSVCIEYQPGLIEIFLNVQTPDSTDSKKDVTLGKSSCLQTVLNLMDNKKQGSYQCPPDLLCACTDFIQSLWNGLRERAMEVLRSKESFWLSIFCPLEQRFEISEETGQYDIYKMKTVAYCLKILAQEVYVMSSSKLDKKFKSCCQNLAKENKLLKISQFVRESLIIEGKKKTVVLDELNENPALILLLSWKNFLITVSKFKVDELSINDKLKEELLADLLLAIESQFQDELTVLNMKLASVSSALYFTLIKYNISCISKSKVGAVSLKLQELVLMTVANSQMLIPSVQIGLLSSLTALLQAPDNNIKYVLFVTAAIPADNLSALLPTVCAVLLQSSRQLPALKELLEKQTTTGEEATSGSGEKTDSENGLDVKLKLQIVCCCLLEELIHSINDSTIWLTVLQQNSILPTLLTSVETYIKAQKGLSYVHSAFLLLLTIAETEKGASVLALNNLAVHTCLVITKCYSQDGRNGQHFQKKYSSLKNNNGIHWSGVYCLCIQLYSTLLSSLRYSFLEDCFNFLGAHQERLQQSLETGCITLYDQSLQEAEVTCSFIYQLSFFIREWRFNLPEVLMKLLTSMVYMTQTFISLLIRPRYLSHLLESLETGCITLYDQSLQEAEVTCSFIYQLSFFIREWRFNLPEVLMKLLTSMVYMTQTFISLLIRPRYLSHLLEAQRGIEGSEKSKHNLHSSPLLQQQTSTEDIDHPSKQLLNIQQSLLHLWCGEQNNRVISLTIAAFCNYVENHMIELSPLQYQYTKTMDISEYEPILGLGFSTPSIDQEAPPTFGMLISCITSCFRLLSKIDPKGGSSPHKSPDTEAVQLISKNHVVYVMDNSLYLIMSQACRYLKDPNLSTREKQFLKRELGAELNSFLSSMLRYMRRGAGPVSPVSTTHSSPQSAHTLNRSISQTTFSNSPEQKYLQLVQEFVKKFLR